MLVTYKKNEQLNTIQPMTCNRCGEEHDLNPIGLCTTCNTQVDLEYSLMYTSRTMEY